MLCEVGVLVLIDENIAEVLLIVMENVGVVAQQDVGVVEQIVEVHGSGGDAAVAVTAINYMDQRTAGAGIGLDDIL